MNWTDQKIVIRICNDITGETIEEVTVYDEDSYDAIERLADAAGYMIKTRGL